MRGTPILLQYSMCSVEMKICKPFKNIVSATVLRKVKLFENMFKASLIPEVLTT